MRWIHGVLAALAPLAFAAAPDIATTAATTAGTTADPAISIDVTRLYGSGLNQSITADRQGNIVLVGQSGDCSLPVVHPLSACGWLWIAKLDPTGQTILFATYFGDPKAQASVVSVQTDLEGNIVVASSVTQSSLPAVNAFQAQANGSYDAYILKLAADGSRVIYATYLGGSGFDNPQALAMDSHGAAYILLQSDHSPDFPTTSRSLQSTAADNWVVAKLSPDGQSLQYAAAFPLGNSFVNRLQIDTAGTAWIIIGNQMLQLAADGSSLQRQPVPPWAMDRAPMLLPAEPGGYWLAGLDQNQVLPTTADAYQAGRSPTPYLRIEKGQLPPLAKAMTAQQVSGFAVDPFETWRIYAATNAGLFMSEDNGWTWNATSITGPCDAVAVDPFDQNTLYLISVGGFYRSSDRGSNWTRLAAGAGGSIAVDPHVQGLIYTAAGRSEDSGVTWQPFTIAQPVNGPCGSGCLFTRATGAVADPAQARRVYVLTETRCIGFCIVIPGLVRSDDAGRTFEGVPTSGVAFGGMAVDPATQDLFVVSGGAVTVFRNSNLSEPEVLSVPEAQSIAADPGNPGTLYLALTNTTVIQSSDGGRTWTPFATVPAPPPLMAVSIGGVLHLSQPVTLTNAFAFHYNSGQILYGTVFGGWNTTPTTAALGSNGHLYLGGATAGGLPLRNPWQQSFGGRSDGFVAEFDSNGVLLNSTYVGGALDDQVTSLVPLDDGSVMVLGYSNSKEFLSQLKPSPIGAGTYFVLRLHPAE